MKKKHKERVLPSVEDADWAGRTVKWSFQSREHLNEKDVENNISTFEYFFGNVLNKINYSKIVKKIKDS